MTLSDAAREEIRQIAARYPEGRQKSAVMPALYVAQNEHGWLAPELLREVAELLALPPVHVAAVATFYTMYEKQPCGRNIIDVCCSVSCLLTGGYDLLERLEQKLGVKRGETTADGRFTLREAECIGACANAPALQVNYRFHENLTPETLDELLDQLLAEEPLPAMPRAAATGDDAPGEPPPAEERSEVVSEDDVAESQPAPAFESEQAKAAVGLEESHEVPGAPGVDPPRKAHGSGARSKGKRGAEPVKRQPEQTTNDAGGEATQPFSGTAAGETSETDGGRGAE